MREKEEKQQSSLRSHFNGNFRDGKEKTLYVRRNRKKKGGVVTAGAKKRKRCAKEGGRGGVGQGERSERRGVRLLGWRAEKGKFRTGYIYRKQKKGMTVSERGRRRYFIYKRSRRKRERREKRGRGRRRPLSRRFRLDQKKIRVIRKSTRCFGRHR